MWIQNYISTYTSYTPLIFAYDVKGVLQSSTYIPLSKVQQNNGLGAIGNPYIYSKGYKLPGYYKGAYDSNVIVYISSLNKYKTYYNYNKKSVNNGSTGCPAVKKRKGTFNCPYAPFIQGWQGSGFYKSYSDPTSVFIITKKIFDSIYNLSNKTENNSNYNGALISPFL